jgi:hypothetical protein
MKIKKSLKILIGFIVFVVVVFFGYKYVQQITPKSDDTTSLKSLAMIVNNLTPEHWQMYNKVMHFTAENLYEQINGRAEYYIAYDVSGLTFASFEKISDSDLFINLSIYDMVTPLNAFGVFSGERSSGSQRLELGRDAYISGANYYIWHGHYYIQIIALDTLEEFKTIGAEIAKKLTDILSDSGEPVWGLTALPKSNRVPQSIQYFTVDALGLDFMHNTYTAKYKRGESVLSVFLSEKNSSESAQIILDNFTTYAKKYGEGINLISQDKIKLVCCDMGGSYDVIFQKGSLIAGVTGVEKESLAIQATIDLWKQL